MDKQEGTNMEVDKLSTGDNTTEVELIHLMEDIFGAEFIGHGQTIDKYISYGTSQKQTLPK